MLQLLSNNGTTWGKLFLRKRLLENNIRYNENVFYGGDKLYTMQYVAHINRVIYNDKAFPYNYVNNFNPSKFMKDFEKEMTNFLEIEINLKKSFSSRFQYQWLVVHLKLLVLSIYARYHKSKERKEKLEIVKNHVNENNDFVLVSLQLGGDGGLCLLKCLALVKAILLGIVKIDDLIILYNNVLCIISQLKACQKS
mgnify:CR=1 FL=1